MLSTAKVSKISKSGSETRSHWRLANDQFQGSDEDKIQTTKQGSENSRRFKNGRTMRSMFQEVGVKGTSLVAQGCKESDCHCRRHGFNP